jgi:hypothetical protein
MKNKAIPVKRKKSGRPAIRTEPLYGLRIGEDLMAPIQKWGADNDTTRSEAIRCLIELGLAANAKPKRQSVARAHRAKELASKAIDKLTAGAPEHEKANRKRRLIKGPEEFREVRVDWPKPTKA